MLKEYVLKEDVLHSILFSPNFDLFDNVFDMKGIWIKDNERQKYTVDQPITVVRCKDCYFRNEKEFECRIHPTWHPDDNYFCADGKYEEEVKIDRT